MSKAKKQAKKKPTALEKLLTTHTKKLMNLRGKLEELRMNPRLLRGDALDEEIRRRDREISEVSLITDLSLPDIPMAIGIMAAVAFLFLVRERLVARRSGNSIDSNGLNLQWTGIGGVLVLTVIYCGAMQFGLIGFPLATALFVPLLGAAISARKFVQIAGLLCVGVILGLGLYFLFTEIFVIDLPGGLQ